MRGDRILIVEDDAFLRDGLTELLEREGYRPVAAASLQAARTRLTEQEAALVVLDVMLPDGTGFDFCAELRDLAGIGELRDLECLGLNGTAVQSLEGIQGLNRLREIGLNNTPVTDLSALGECDFSFAAENGGVKIWIPNIFEIRDWSFLERIPKFEWLSLGGIDPELWTEHVQGAQVIGFFGRFDTQKQMKTFLEAHPEIEDFEIPWCNSITDLSMLPGMPNLRYVHITDTMNQAVLSLEGTEYGFELWVEGTN